VRRRRAYLDNLKVVLVMTVIVGHAFITYGDVGSWAYREPSTSEAFNVVAGLVVALGSLFAMGVFFLIAGMLTPGPLRHKGSLSFLRDRGLRLGLPFLLFLLVYPTVVWWGEQGRAALGDYLMAQLRLFDPGPLWFVLVLLLFSAGYVAWRAVRPAATDPVPLRVSTLVWLGAAIAAATVLVRLQFPIDSYQVLALHVWQWPQCLGLFLLGVACAERGWLDPVPDRLRRGSGAAALVGVAVIVVAFSLGHESLDPFAGGLTVPAITTAVCEAVIAIGLSVWLLGHFQRRHDRTGRLRSAMGRAAFGAYVLQAPVLVVLAVALADLVVAPEVKFLLVAPLGVAASFGLAWLLTRVPGVNRIV
jgi:surface polysaccharide O-acyltransferase-like enzyme